MNQSTPIHISPQELQNLLLHDSQNLVLIDVREDNELEIAPFPSQVFHFPLSQHSTWKDTFPTKISNKNKVVVICHAGVRSWNFGLWLIEQCWGYEVLNLQGGIDAWSLTIDNSVPRY